MTKEKNNVKYYLGIIMVLLFSSIIYIQFQDDFKIKIDKDKSIFYSLIENKWEVSGTEYNKLFDGNRNLYRDLSELTLTTEVDNISKITTITRVTPYKKGCTIKDTYIFDGKIEDIELFPISHKVEVFDCKDKFYRYIVKDLVDVSEKYKFLSGETSATFGNNIKVEWEEGYNWAWIGYPYKKNSLSVQYKIKSDYEIFNVRLFDPSSLINLSLSEYYRNVTAELGSTIFANATLDGSTVCIDIDHPDYGNNYSCAVNSTTFNVTIDYFRQEEAITNITWCYQETANVSTACGGLSTGTYSWIGSWYAGFLGYYVENIFDGDWGTSGMARNDIGDTAFYINYTKPTNALSSSLWQLKYGRPTEQILTNSTILSNCWNYDNNILSFRAYKINESDYTTFDCYDGSDWNNLKSYEYSGLHNIYEEGMFWEIGTTNQDTFNITYTNNILENQTFYILSHQYDEVLNLSLNITAYETGNSYPSKIKIYIDDTLSNNIGHIGGSLTSFNDSTTYKNVTFTDEETKTIGHFKIPKYTNVTSAVFDIKGYNYTYVQENSDNVSYNLDTYNEWNNSILFDYEKKDRSFEDYEYKFDSVFNPQEKVNGSQTVLQNCYDNGNNYWLQLKFNYDYETSPISEWNLTMECYNGSDWLNISSSNIYNSYGLTLNMDLAQSLTTDNDWDTGACWLLFSWESTLHCYYNGNPIFYDEQIYWSSYTRNPWLQIGVLNGTYNWNYTSVFNVDDGTIDDFSARLNVYLAGCTPDSNDYCDVPVYMYSDTGGIIEITNIEINFSIDAINPVLLDKDIIQTFLDDATGEVYIPIKIESLTNGTLQIDDIKFDHRGGNDTITYLAHSTDYGFNISHDVTYYYSDWTHSFPANIDYMEFIPTDGPTQKNVTPYGQTSTKPILNFTSQSYGGKTFNFTILINESSSCVNDTVSLTNNKSVGDILVADTWITYKTTVDYEDDFDLYSWADFECSYSTWHLWNPYWYMRACCNGCDICTDTVYNIGEL